MVQSEIIEFGYGTWEEVNYCWKNNLWPGRSEINPIVGMTYDKGFDIEIEKNQPRFFIAKTDDKVIGVNSGFNTSPDYYRSRGLWVHQNFRNRGVATQLLLMTVEEAISNNNSYMWTIPRKDALSTYENIGFKKTSKFTHENMLYGPNCYALLNLKLYA